MYPSVPWRQMGKSIMGARVDHTGKKFQKLTVIKFDRYENNHSYWWFQCECGNTKSIDIATVKNGHTQTCGAIIHIIKDITGQVFHSLTAIRFDKRENKTTYWWFQCKCGNERSFRSDNVTDGKRRSCGECIPEPYNIQGQKFGKLTVLQFSHQDPTYGNNARIWLCKCDCGTEIQTTYSHLVGGYSASCGCTRRIEGEENHKWKGKNNISGTYWSSIAWGAYHRNLELSIDLQYIEGLFEKQNQQCALTRQKLIPAKSTTGIGTASLDRIDNSQGYIPGNVQWVHKDINKMKQTYSQEYFIEMCNQVAQTHPSSNNKHLNNTITISGLIL